jgi:predicted GIY-YIG superfamily endonuclease
MGCYSSKTADVAEKTVYRVYVCSSNSKWYVGVTSKPLSFRLAEHIQGTGATWTAIYTPNAISLHREFLTRREANVEETAHTLELMRIHGISNVRGGRYASVHFSYFDLKSISKEMAHNDSLCYKCMQPGHSSRQCESSQDNNCGVLTKTGKPCKWPVLECPHHMRLS